MKRTWLKIMMFGAFGLLTGSCAKEVTESEETEQAERNSLLTLTTRDGGTADEEESVAYPVNVYVFNSSSKCIDLVTLQDNTDALTLRLAKGQYTFYAIGEAATDRYSLPTLENATPQSRITTLEGKVLDDLMTASAKVTIEPEENATVTLSMNRKVAKVRNVSIKNVPASVTGVRVTIESTSEAILLNGEYDGHDGRHDMTLTRQSDGTTWKNGTESYMFPTFGDANITVRLTDGTTTTAYSHSANEALNANYIVDIEGTFTGGDVALTGTIKGTQWEGVKTITFDFDDTNKVDNGGDSGGDNSSPVVSGTVPAVGSTYQGCYVLAVNGNTATVLSSVQKNNVYTKDDEESKVAGINEALGTWVVSGISGVTWRLPNKDEMTKIYQNRSNIGSDMFSYGYFFLNSSGTICRMDYNGKEQTASPILYLRPVADITFQ